MGCATSLCSCTHALATVSPKVASANLARHRKCQSASQKSRFSPSLVSIEKKSSHWSSYDIEIRDYDEYSVPCEIESDEEDSDQANLCDHYKDADHRPDNPDHGHLLTDQSKWTVTVKLYAKKAGDERSSDIPSVEETGSHYSSGEWHGKSSSSQGSHDSARGKAHRNAVSNGIIPKEYTKNTKNKLRKDRSDDHVVSSTQRRPVKLHYSYSERPLTKEELARHEKMSKTFNPTYAWANAIKSGKSTRVFDVYDQRLNNSVPPNGFNGLSVGLGTHQKYQHTGSLSQYLSLGTNHYKRSSLRDSNRRKKKDTEENWESLCDNVLLGSRPKSTMGVVASDDIFNAFDNGVDLDSNLSTSPVDSLITDYLAETEILEDFSGSTNSLNTNTSGKGTSVSTSAKDSSPESMIHGHRDSLYVESRYPTVQPDLSKSSRPGAALRRHRSEPFHFLV